jgi:hypothetical protein
MRTLLAAALVGLAAPGLTGCGNSTAEPQAASPAPPLTFDEWNKIADPEEKFNRETLMRLPKDQREKAAKVMSKKS